MVISLGTAGVADGVLPVSVQGQPALGTGGGGGGDRDGREVGELSGFLFPRSQSLKGLN